MKVRYRALDKERSAFIKRKNHQVKLDQIQTEIPRSEHAAQNSQDNFPVDRTASTTESKENTQIEDSEMTFHETEISDATEGKENQATENSQSQAHTLNTEEPKESISESQSGHIVIEKNIQTSEESDHMVEERVEELLNGKTENLDETKRARREQWTMERKARMMSLRKEILKKKIKKREWRIEIMSGVLGRLLDATEKIVAQREQIKETEESDTYRNREKLQMMERNGAKMVESYLRTLSHPNQKKPHFQVITERTDECDEEDLETGESGRLRDCSQILNSTLLKEVTGMVPSKKLYLDADVRSDTQRRRRKFSELPKLTDILETLTRMSFNHHTRTNSFRQNSIFYFWGFIFRFTDFWGWRVNFGMFVLLFFLEGSLGIFKFGCF